jgi:signal transduction protein with GAF and PtsI domain
MAADLLTSQNCSIMLFRDDSPRDPRMKIFASHGYLPPAAYSENARHREGIAGHVAATGEALLVADIEKSPYASKARWPDRSSKGFLSAPIFIGGKVLGVINVNSPLDERRYTERDLYLLTCIALVVGKSIQVVQLQSILKSRFAQHALMQQTRANVSESLAQTAQNPGKLARMVGKSFYREMSQAGFSDEAIIKAATEVISLLGRKVAKHDRRLEKSSD